MMYVEFLCKRLSLGTAANFDSMLLALDFSGREKVVNLVEIRKMFSKDRNIINLAPV